MRFYAKQCSSSVSEDGLNDEPVRRFYDCHCHLDMPQFSGDLPEVAERARKEGVQKAISCGIDLKSNRRTLEIADSFISPALGVSPQVSYKMGKEQVTKEIGWIREHSGRIVAIGEVGLDYYWVTNDEERRREEDDFLSFIELANELKKPIIVHSRNAEKNAVSLLSEHSQTPVVLHCFCGPVNVLKRALDGGMYVSVPTNVLYSEKVREVVRNTPEDRLLTETDSPYLAPQRGARNEPKNIPLVVKEVSLLKGCDPNNLTITIERTFRSVFRI